MVEEKPEEQNGQFSVQETGGTLCRKVLCMVRKKENRPANWSNHTIIK